MDNALKVSCEYCVLQILQPNGEKPQAKQLQSRADYLIKIIRKAQDLNHPGMTSVRRHGQPIPDPSPGIPPRVQELKVT